MFLDRIGKKGKIADLIIKHFPPHTYYLEPFFGAGGIFFNKYPISKYNIMNDYNNNISNLFKMAMNGNLLDLVEIAPYHLDVVKWFNENDFKDNDGMRALKFLFASNFSVFGMGKGLTFGNTSNKKYLIEKIKEFLKSDFIKYTQFTNCDFREFLDLIRMRWGSEKNKMFLYSDPPYYETQNTYGEDLKTLKWEKKDVIDLFEIHVNSGIKFAISEFDNPFILDMAEKYNLNVIPILERHNFKNRRNEILITNYNTNNLNNFLDKL